MSDEAGPAEWELLDRTRARLVALDAERFRLLEDIAELERRDVASSTGDRSTARLLEEIGRLARGEAQRLVAEARDLVPGRSLQGEPLPPRRPCTARVHASGEIGAAHVAIIRRTMDRVDRVVTVRPETAAWAEAFLAEQATLLGPRGLERVARQLLEAVDPDGTAPDEGEDGFDELRLHQRPDGSLVLRGAIHDAADVALVRAVSTPPPRPPGRTTSARSSDAGPRPSRSSWPGGAGAPPGGVVAAGARCGVSRWSSGHAPSHWTSGGSPAPSPTRSGAR